MYSEIKEDVRIVKLNISNFYKDSKTQNSRFHNQKFPEFRDPDEVTVDTNPEGAIERIRIKRVVLF